MSWPFGRFTGQNFVAGGSVELTAAAATITLSGLPKATWYQAYVYLACASGTDVHAELTLNAATSYDFQYSHADGTTILSSGNVGDSEIDLHDNVVAAQGMVANDILVGFLFLAAPDPVLPISLTWIGGGSMIGRNYAGRANAAWLGGGFEQGDDGVDSITLAAATGTWAAGSKIWLEQAEARP